MSRKLSFKTIAYITGQSEKWVKNNISKFGYKCEDEYYTNIKELEDFLIYSNELDHKENTF
jgi:hypothetical protein